MSSASAYRNRGVEVGADMSYRPQRVALSDLPVTPINVFCNTGSIDPQIAPASSFTGSQDTYLCGTFCIQKYNKIKNPRSRFSYTDYMAKLGSDSGERQENKVSPKITASFSILRVFPGNSAEGGTQGAQMDFFWRGRVLGNHEGKAFWVFKGE